MSGHFERSQINMFLLETEMFSQNSLNDFKKSFICQPILA